MEIKGFHLSKQFLASKFKKLSKFEKIVKNQDNLEKIVKNHAKIGKYREILEKNENLEKIDENCEKSRIFGKKIGNIWKNRAKL